MVTEQLMTVRQVADFLQISTDKVYAMAQDGQIPAIKIGNQWRFKKDEVDAWLKSCTVISASKNLRKGKRS